MIAGEEEIEGEAGLVLGLYFLPGIRLRSHHFTQEQVDEANGPGYWHLETGLSSDQTNGWLVFADPFHLDAENWLRSWDEAYAPAAIVGGLASGDYSERLTQLYLNGEVFEEGGVAVSVGGDVELASLISQGCTPIGETWTITKVEGNLIQQIGNRPAYEILLETFNSLSPEEQQKATGNLFVGLVINEYLDEFRRGDFLIRNLLGADPKSGAIAVGASPWAGQTLQFQRRDAAAATEDITALLQRAKTQLASTQIYGACLCSCNGRGQNLFGYAHHDTRHIQQELGPLGLTGFFCNGEIGPWENGVFCTDTRPLWLFSQKRPYRKTHELPNLRSASRGGATDRSKSGPSSPFVREVSRFGRAFPEVRPLEIELGTGGWLLLSSIRKSSPGAQFYWGRAPARAIAKT